MLSSLFYGEKDRFSLGELVQVMVSHSLALVSAASVVVALGARWLIALFLGNDPAVLEIATPGLRLYALSLIVCAVVTVYKNYFRPSATSKFTYLVAFLESIGCTTLLSWLLSRALFLNGVWLGLLAGQLATLAVICALIWWRYGSISFTKDAFLFLDSGFGAVASDCLDLSVSDITSAVQASERIFAFCQNKTPEHRTPACVRGTVPSAKPR